MSEDPTGTHASDDRAADDAGGDRADGGDGRDDPAADRVRVAVAVRSGTDLLLWRPSGDDRWRLPTGRGTAPPEDLGRSVVAEVLGDEGATLRRTGDAVGSDGDRLIPLLFERDTRGPLPDDGDLDHEYEWAPPTVAFERPVVPWLWPAYREVAPTVGAVRDDREHGAAWLSVRACEVLRDRAAELAAGGAVEATEAADGDGRTDAPGAVLALGRDLRTARPSMVAVGNRVDRVLADATDPAAVVERAGEVLAAALAADADAAERAARELDGADHVLTLSRSGTVARTLETLDPERVSVVESRPGAEGVSVAESFAEDGRRVTLLPDSAVAHAVTAVDAVLVGADTLLPDGRVVNKVGTRGALLAAAHDGVPAVVVAARDKVSPTATTDLEPRPRAAVYDGDAPLDVLAPTFDVSPADAARVVTEDGVLDRGDVAALARAARERARRVDPDDPERVDRG
jgi:translation initiation factor 2B subunit (eIF-2B alpha/beta/delta family)